MYFKTTVDGCEVEVSMIDSLNVLVFVPGIPGHANSREIVAANKGILDANIASTVRYTSRRDFEAWEKARGAAKMLTYTKPDRAGMLTPGSSVPKVPKTYQDELMDLGVAVDFALDENPDQIYLSGFSYGGGLATLLLNESFAERVTKVLLTSPQTYAPNRDGLPCFGGFPEKERFLEAIAGYEGKLMVVHHEDDPVVAVADVAELVSRAGTNKKEFKLLDGTYHGFVHDPAAYAELHRDFFQE
tara:strand:- start:1533 stop:2264 length:732 start_codon:yes stop_codon:yes gene_type:complete